MVLPERLTSRKCEDYAESRDGKISLIRTLGITPGAEEFIDSFQPSEQLNERLKRLAEKLGVRPWTLEDAKAEKERIDRLLHPTSRPASQSTSR